MSIDNRVAVGRPTFGRARGSEPTPSPSRQTKPSAQSNAPAPAAAEQDSSFSMMRVVSRAFTTLVRNGATFGALIALAAIPERAIYHLIDPANPFASSISSIVLSLCIIVLQGALTKGAFDSFQGEPVTLGRCLDKGVKSFLPLLAIGFLSALGIGAFALLLIVPGVWLALGWSVVVPARIAETTGIGASFARSTELTRGYRWQILGLSLMLVAVTVLVAAVMAPLWGISLGGLSIFLLRNWLVRLVLAAITALCLASLYYELCLAKEGGMPQETGGPETGAV
jgi:hypothetical protein